MQNDDLTYTGSVVSMSPTYVGYLELSPGFRIAFTKKPIWFHRQMIKLVFGWIWIDGKL
jgi:hypothetical protein